MIPVLAQKNEVASVHWKNAGELPAMKGQKKSLGVAGAVIGIHGDFLIVAGGANFPDNMPWDGGTKKYYDEGFVLKKNENEIFEVYKTFNLPYPMGYTANYSISTGIIAAGGENHNGNSKKVLLIKWNDVKSEPDISDLPDLPIQITNASATSIGNKIYLAGGEMGNVVSDKFLVLDLNNINAGWQLLPPIPKPVSHAVIAVHSNPDHDYIFLIGGRKKNQHNLSEVYSSTLRFDLKTNQWSEKKDLPYKLSAGTGVAVGKNSILLLGGDRGETFSKTESLLLAIDAETDEKKKQLLIEQKNKLQSSHPGFSNEVLLYNIVTDDWKKIGCMPQSSPVTTTAIKWNDEILIPSGEIKAGVRTPVILSGKILFTVK